MSLSISGTSTAGSAQWAERTAATNRRERPQGPPPGGAPCGPPPTGAILDLSADLLAKLDADGDGSIDLATEAAGAAGGPPPPPFVAEADTDGDGTVTSTELQARMAQFDTSGDDSIDADEWEALRPPGPPPAGSDTGAVSIDGDRLRSILGQLRQLQAAMGVDDETARTASS